VIQLIYGAFIAGLKAANVAPTWPDINGTIIPNSLFVNGIARSMLHNAITIQFIHRIIAYVLFILILAWWFKTKKERASLSFNIAKKWPPILVITQVVLGILTVINSTSIVLGKFGVFEWLAELHQLTGMLLLLSMISVICILKPSD
jgi:heme a synthase